MSRIEVLKFIGGPEDGKHHAVNYDVWTVPERWNPNVVPIDGPPIGNGSEKTFTYIRRGNVMVFDP